MITLMENKRRRLVEDYGPYMNKRYAIYDNTGTLEVWFSDEERAKEWWSKNSERPTFSEQRRENTKGLTADLVIIDELPFM